MAEESDRSRDLTRIVVAAKGLCVARRRYQAALCSQMGLSTSQSDCLFYAVVNDAIRQGDLPSTLGISPSAVSLVVSELCGSGFLERREDPSDGRAVILVPTEAGRAVFEPRIRRTASVFAPPHDEADTMLRALTQAAALFESLADDAQSRSGIASPRGAAGSASLRPGNDTVGGPDSGNGTSAADRAIPAAPGRIPGSRRNR